MPLAERKIKVGVVGLGAFGKHHARHYAAHPSAALVAAADADAARASEVAARYGADAVTSHRDLIGRVDAVSIAVPASHHHAVAADLLDAGIHVLIEKPIAANSGEARDLIARAARTGAILQVGHIERFSPVSVELRQRIRAPRRIACVRRAVWNERNGDVDVVLDLMIHDIDLLLTLAGAPVASLSASGSIVRSRRIDEAEAWLTFANGLTATLSASRVAERNERKIAITEPDTTYAADMSAPSLTIASRSRWGAAPEAVALPARDSLAAEIAAFLTSIATGARAEVDGEAGLAALEIAERIQAAIADADTPMRREGAR